jgi:hypothetical protein
MNQGTEWGLLMKKNRSQKSRASVPLSIENFEASIGIRPVLFEGISIQQNAMNNFL